MGEPFDRLDFYKNVSYYVEHHWGSYLELIEMTMKDFIEISIGLKSKEREEELNQSIH